MTPEELNLLYTLLPWLLPVLLIQSIVLFIDAKKKESYAWFWGIWGLIQFPLPTLLYLLFVVYPHHKRKNRRIP
ncbi:Negative regulatory protein YxlD [Bacillus sp. THAF10]|uniref:transcriptional regulator n=1 Tax=Bacillus sp. THAF10 TaxID=2587848 RepID=UPI0012684EED|nr:transcriptional regulator [Bacillus sp. THAF10]QFT87428.1 Negative regulatory protein YxlD [Bacillus sp. THAF10]